MTAGRRFCVLLGPDGAGKSSVMRGLAGLLPEWRLLSTDPTFVAPEHALVTRLRRDLEEYLLPGLGTAYSADFLASVLQTAVVYMRDQVHGRDPQVPVLVDSYYYKILAKCRIAGVRDNPMFDWWRTFPQPDRVVYLDASPASAWRRLGDGAGLNSLEYEGDEGDMAGFERYQKDLRKLMLEEVRDLPVTGLPEQPSVERTVELVRKALTA